LSLKAMAGDITRASAEAIIVNLLEGVTTPRGGTGAVDKALKGILKAELAQNTVFKGQLGKHLVIHTHGKLSARYVVVVGLGPEKTCDNLALRRAAAVSVQACQALGVSSATILLHGAGVGKVTPKTAARLLAEGALLGAYQFTLRKSSTQAKPVSPKLKTLTVVEHDPKKLPAIQAGLALGQVIGTSTNQARDWVNDSANYLTPTRLVALAKAVPGLKCKIFDSKAIVAQGMGSFASVFQGSDHPAYLIQLTYTPPASTAKAKKLKTVCLVGKGITFDSGGLSIKPADTMAWMKFDMGGAAAVLGTMVALANLPDAEKPTGVVVHGLIPTCENLINGHATKPGDIVTSKKGLTIEVNNTDAEGRLILCDTLTYAQEALKPDTIIDLATLTGACIIALGKVASGIMGSDDALMGQIQAAGLAAGERYWPLPLYDEYADLLKSDVADLKNSGTPKGEAGTVSAGAFLKKFITPGQSWAHIDIAGTAYIEAAQPEMPRGATGVGVRTLLYDLLGLG
jgi:leucyl aminopeptidase